MSVITAANTAIPTISAIRSVGATPKLIDIGDDYLIDVSKIKKFITKKLKRSFLYTCMVNVVTWMKSRKFQNNINLKLLRIVLNLKVQKYKNKFSGTIMIQAVFLFIQQKY